MSPSETLAPTDLFSLQFLRDARLSPDGSYVVYGLSRTDDQERFEIWIANVTGEGKRRLPYVGNARSARWSPDGRWIAFDADGRLRVAAFPDFAISDPLTPVHLAVQGAPSWSPDSRLIAVSLLESRAVPGPRHITSRLFRADGIGLVGGLTQRIYAVDRCDNSLRALSQPGTLCSQPQWSPCGRRILFLASDDAIPFASYSPKLFTVEVSDGQVNEVLGERWFIGNACWLPGGDRIAVAAARDSTLTVPTLSLWVVDAITAEAELRTQGLVGNIGCRIHHDMPAWDLTASMLAVADQNTAYASVQKRGAVEIWRISLAGELSMEPVITGERACLILDVHADSNTLLFSVSELNSPTELWRRSLAHAKEERLTSLNDAVLAKWPTTHVERFTFNSADGLGIDAWFMADARRKGPLPTVMFIHGGPFIATGEAFRYDFLLLASRGFGVLFANFRGSAGYGEPFARAIMGDYGARGFPDHMGAADAAISRGFADPNRLGVWGASHGGFATCWIVGHTLRFKAAVAEAAVTNFTTTYYLSDAPDGIVRDLGGPPHEIPDIYRSRSPLTYAHRCTTPTLLLHGEDDLRCPIAEAEQFYRALQDVGCITELLRIPDCSHLGDSIGPLSARRAQNEGLIDWFQRHL